MCEQFAPLRGRLAGQGQGRRVTVSFSSAQQQPRCHKVHLVYQKHNVLHSSSPSRLHVTADVLPGISSQAAELPLVHITQCSALQLAAGRQTGRQTRWTDGWTYRQTDTQADRQADRQTGRWINRQDATGLNTCSWAGRGGHRNTCSELTSCYLLKNFARIDNQL